MMFSQGPVRATGRLRRRPRRCELARPGRAAPGRSSVPPRHTRGPVWTNGKARPGEAPYIECLQRKHRGTGCGCRGARPENPLSCRRSRGDDELRAGVRRFASFTVAPDRYAGATMKLANLRTPARDSVMASRSRQDKGFSEPAEQQPQPLPRCLRSDVRCRGASPGPSLTIRPKRASGVPRRAGKPPRRGPARPRQLADEVGGEALRWPVLDLGKASLATTSGSGFARFRDV